MEANLKHSVNKLALVGGCVIAIQGIGLNFLVSLVVSIVIVFIASSLNDAIRIRQLAAGCQSRCGFTQHQGNKK